MLAQVKLIAEPWDVGPGGYQLGNFPPNWLEWNDRYRDDVRRFWRGTATVGDLATRIAGSSDLFGQDCRSINFLAAHDGFTLADTVAYEQRHNHANGEDNRDGHGENHSWNCGVEGPSNDPAILARRAADMRALLETLFASTGTIMLTAGDEFGRSQGGNNNAYAQDNEITWLDWENGDGALVDFFSAAMEFRQAHPALTQDRFLSGQARGEFKDVAWLHPDGREMNEGDWSDPAASVLGMHLRTPSDEVLVWFNRRIELVHAKLPPGEYKLVVEAAREVGGREVVTVPFKWPAAKAEQLSAKGSSELGEISVELKP